MKNKSIKLNQILFEIAGACAFIWLANLLAVAEGVNAPQNPSSWLVATFWFGVAGAVARAIGMIARRH